MTALQIRSISIRETKPDEKKLPAYDHTKLSAINTCPTWGIVRYSLHKTLAGAGRQLALEAGTVSHEGFAAVRLYQLMFVDGYKELADYHGRRCFGDTRWERMLGVLSSNSLDRTNIVNFVLETIYSGEYFDDPSDKYRTVANICESLIAYCDRWDMKRYPVWIRDPSDPKSDVGIENPFDMMVTIIGERIIQGTAINIERTIRYTGKIDGIHWDKKEILPMENKTGFRIDEAWLAQWLLSHQITGYALATGTFVGAEVSKARILGMKIPIGRSPLDGIKTENTSRGPDSIIKWGEWLVHTVEIEREFIEDIPHAPMYTHSCNRYFRPCSMLAYCTADSEEKEQILSEMRVEEWSPLDDD